MHRCHYYHIDDCPEDLELTLLALQETAEHPVNYTGTADPVDGLTCLQGGISPLPHVVILDLNMPCLGGFELLARLRADRRLQEVPVIVLTTSSNPDDHLRALRTGANQVITKPATFLELLTVARDIHDWCPHPSA